MNKSTHQPKSFAPILCLLLLIMLGLGACSSYKNIAYFENAYHDSAAYTQGLNWDKTQYPPLVIQNGDILQIALQTKIPNTSSTLSGETPQVFTAEDWKSAGAAGQVRTTQTNVPAFKVDESGMVNMPIIGKVKVTGLTIPEISDLIQEKAAYFVVDPIVNVRLANFKVSVLGEVNHPGAYYLEQDKSSILDAISIAGDLSIYGKRQNILLSREVNGKEKTVLFDLTSTNIFQSPYFYLKPGDVIYVQPSKGKAFANDAATIRWFSIGLSSITAISLILTQVRR